MAKIAITTAVSNHSVPVFHIREPILLLQLNVHHALGTEFFIQQPSYRLNPKLNRHQMIVGGISPSEHPTQLSGTAPISVRELLVSCLQAKIPASFKNVASRTSRLAVSTL
jgi:hypothetical protein